MTGNLPVLSVDVPLDGVPAVVEQKYDRLEVLTHHHGELLNGELAANASVSE